jgi:phage terminase Nu1 subunit (DNA packaging protein)
MAGLSPIARIWVRNTIQDLQNKADTVRLLLEPLSVEDNQKERLLREIDQLKTQLESIRAKLLE